MHLHKIMARLTEWGFARDIENKNNRIYLTLALSKDKTVSGDFYLTFVVYIFVYAMVCLILHHRLFETIFYFLIMICLYCMLYIIQPVYVKVAISILNF